MTPGERARPELLNARRRQRIARGSGTTVTEVNNLLLRFQDMRKLMKKPGKLKKMMASAGGMGMLGRN
jgi:signal recognition particle subunit SRP54